MPAEIIHPIATLLGFGEALAIVFYGIAALFGLATGRASLDEARRTLAGGVLTAMSFKLGATLLRTIELQDWSSIGMAFAVFALRTAIKWSLQREQRATP